MTDQYRAPLEPVPATAEAFALLGDDAIADDVHRLAEQVRAVVPELVGVSLSFREPGLTFTFATSVPELLPLDGVQYLEGGPCVVALDDDETIEVRGDPLSEERWSLYARAAAHYGVLSSLSVPVHLDGEVVGGLNLYAATEHAFEGHVEEVAALVQAPAGEAIRDADLTFSTRQRAEESLRTMESQITVDVAAGMLAERERIPVQDAVDRLEQAAAQAGIPVASLAVLLIELRGED